MYWILIFSDRRLTEQHGGRQETGSRTVLRELGGAGERGDLETVFGDRNQSRVVELLPCLLLRSLHLQPGRWQTQIDFCVLRLFSISLKKMKIGKDYRSPSSI